MKKIMFMSLVLVGFLSFADVSLDKKIASMFMTNFYGTKLDEYSKSILDLGVHVILSNKFCNITNVDQLKDLTNSIQQYAPLKCIIGVDQEGGNVTRLKLEHGFNQLPSAKSVAEGSLEKAKKIAGVMARDLSSVGITMNFAPVLDVDDKENQVIHKWERSYGEEPKTISNYAAVFLQALFDKKIVGVVKHFPGHGSSKKDTHNGFVDVSSVWEKQELEPYKILLNNKKKLVSAIMISHLFNKYFDHQYPASLSKKTIDFLRKDLDFDGLVVTDDLSMKAISNNYSWQDTLFQALDAGNNLLIYTTVPGVFEEEEIQKITPDDWEKLNEEILLNTMEKIAYIKHMVEQGMISRELIDESYKKIDAIRKKKIFD